MAEEVRSMSISLSMKDLGVDKTISEIRRSFRSLRDDVKLVNKDFQYGEKSIDSYTNRVDELSSAAKIAEDNVEQLSKQYHEVGKEQGYTSKEALRLRQEWAKQKNELNFLQRDLEGATNDLKAFQKQQMISNSNWTKTGNAFTGMSKSLDSISGKLSATGRSLTNSITKPALIAGTAIGGITAKLGFDRLVGLDSAKAKLEGLGYSTKEVGEISDQVTNAIKGGMTTMAEGTDVAAGALASGVKEGKELEHYIKLVGDAAVGANRPVSDMAMIFNRVQGQGKLMTEELNMIEEGMPGFSKAMAKHLGVSYEEFRKMVTEGQVTSKDFLTVMDDFAGGMAGAYSKSFKGMLSNTKAYIGMIGESLLSGVFEKSKDSLAEFEKLLQSPSVQKWAQETGDKLGNAVNTISNAISGIIGWFNSLDKGTQKNIASIMKWSTLILIGIGPVLTILGKMTGALAGTFGTFGKFLGFMGKLSVESKTAGGLLKGFTNLMPKTGAVITALTGPIGWITLGIVALGTAFVIAYKKSETFRNIVNAALNGVKQTFINIGNVVKGFFQLFKGNGQDGVITLSKILPPNVVVGLTNFATKVKTIFFQVINTIKTFATSIGSQLNAFWSKNGTEIMIAVKNIGSAISTTFKFIWNNIIKPIMTLIWNLMKVLWPAIRMLIVSVWNNIKGVIQGALNIILGVIKVFSSLLTGNWRGVWQGIVQIIKGVVILVWNLIQLWFVGKVLSVVKVGLAALKGVVTRTWSFIRGFIATLVISIWNKVKSAFNGLYETTKSIFTNVKNFLLRTWNYIKNMITNKVHQLWYNVRRKFKELQIGIYGIILKLRGFLIDKWTDIKDRTVGIVTTTKDKVVNGFKAMYDKGKSWIDKLKNFLKDSVSGFKNIAKKVGNGVANGAISGLNAMIDGINSLSNKIMNKKLIKKKIPKLSTGTGVQTDSNGLLTRSTKAIVNDKGPGNGTGPNGHKELIYRRSGKIERPIGNNKKVTLRRGDGVLNGAQSQSLLPHLSTGTVMDRLFGQGSGAKGDKKKPKDKKKWYEKAGENIGDAWDSTKDAGKKVVSATSKGVESVMKGIGDVWDYASNPSKLINKVMGGLGINFDSIGGVMGNFIKWGAKKLKEGMVDLVTGWFEEESGGAGGDGSSFTKYPKTTPYSPNKPVPGYPTAFNGGRHYGIDYGTPSGVTLTAPTAGKVSKISDYGGGTIAKLLSGNFTQFFMHLSEVLKTGRVKQGEKFAKTGNSGHWTTGAHLHYQVEKGNSGYVTNKNTIDPEKFLAGSGGGSKAASKWRGDIIRAASSMKVNLSPGDIKDIISLIHTESGGRPGVTQSGYTDVNTGGNEARGLLQYTPGTWNAYKAKGAGNILNGYHQLKTFFNNSNWRRDLSSWKSRMSRGQTGWGPTGSRRFATGGIIRSNGLYNLAEEGHEEVVIPTDPRRASDAMKLINYAANKVQRGKNGNKRPNQIKSSTSNVSSDDNAKILQMLAKQIEQQQEQINILTKIALSNQDIADKPVLSEQDLSRRQGNRALNNAYLKGGIVF